MVHIVYRTEMVKLADRVLGHKTMLVDHEIEVCYSEGSGPQGSALSPIPHVLAEAGLCENATMLVIALADSRMFDGKLWRTAAISQRCYL